MSLICFRDMVQIFTKKQNIMKVNGMLIKEVVGVVCIMLMVQFMRENGLMICEMGLECCG